MAVSSTASAVSLIVPRSFRFLSVFYTKQISILIFVPRYRISFLAKNTNSDLLHQLVEYLVIHQWSLQFQNLLSLRNNHYTSKHYLHNDLPLLDQLSLLLVPM